MSEAQETSDYPGSLDTWTTITDKEDLAEASDINKIKAALLALQTELGLDPAGTLTDLVSRLNLLQDSGGGLAQGTSFPVSPTPVDGQAFYRTDENTMYVYNGSSWDAQGTSLSNSIYSWTGAIETSGTDDGLYIGTSLNPTDDATTREYMFFMTDSTSALPMLESRFTKIAGINTVTIHANIWIESGGGNTATCTVDIGGQSNTVTSSSTTPGWATTSDVDVSGLSDGTTYTITVSLHGNVDSVAFYLGGINLIAS